MIQKYHVSFPPTREHDDISFVQQYLLVSDKIYGVKEPLYNYLLRQNSIMGTFYTNSSKANRWDLLRSWRHTVDFALNNRLWPVYEEDLVQLFFSYLGWLQQMFAWERFSKEDLQKIGSYVSGVPLREGTSELEDKLYALQQGKEGFPDSIFYSRTKYVGGILPLKTKTTWNGKRMYLCGVEVYKKNFLTHKARWLGFVPVAYK